MIDLPDISPASSASPFTRRRLLAGGLGAGTALAAAELLLPKGVVSADSEKLDVPGQALQAADRMILEPDDGEIPFPIEVGVDDYCAVLDNFGDCRSGCSRRHEGVDIMADQGLPIRAVAGGVLTNTYVDSGKRSGAGNGWTLYSADTNITWKYFHMDRHEEGLEEGDTIERGQVIGYVGNTGTSGALDGLNHHLHFEYRPDNIALDSFALLHRPSNVTFYEF